MSTIDRQRDITTDHRHAADSGSTTPGSTTPGRTTPVIGYVAAGLRLALGWVFLWAFLDKAFGLGHETANKDAWIHGGSPTKGFLGFAVAGPFESMYHHIAGQAWADWLFMIGLAGIGTALILGVAFRLAVGAGALLLVLMWTAVLPPANNVFMDDHLIYAGTLILLAALGAGRVFGFGKTWEQTELVRQHSWLR